jgi:hypothetical protein
MTEPIHIEGLREFQRGLKAIDKDLATVLRVAFNDAADIVVADARPRVPSRTGRAKGTVKARSTQTAARVVGGGNRAPYYPWLDFGGRLPRGASRPFLKEGRYIYNAYFRARDSGRFQDALQDGLVDVARKAGIEVT